MKKKKKKTDFSQFFLLIHITKNYWKNIFDPGTIALCLAFDQ